MGHEEVCAYAYCVLAPSRSLRAFVKRLTVKFSRVQVDSKFLPPFRKNPEDYYF